MKFIIDLAVGDYTGAKSGLATGRAGRSRERSQIFSRIKAGFKYQALGSVWRVFMALLQSPLTA